MTKVRMTKKRASLLRNIASGLVRTPYLFPANNHFRLRDLGYVEFEHEQGGVVWTVTNAGSAWLEANPNV